jgi:predicted enzyme related to lactoylglutathione lyase
MKNSINWFEIPVTDFDRAKKFYETVLEEKVEEMPHPSLRYGMFAADMQQGGIGGGLVQGEGFAPSMDGSLVYLNGGDDLSVPLSRVVSAGGKVLMEKTSIGPNGFMAHFVDSEGNKVAFHSMG